MKKKSRYKKSVKRNYKTYPNGCRYFKSDRDYEDPQYKKFRSDVRRRDGYTCQWPGCTKTRTIEIHHIRRWTDYPSLRYNVSNGVCLCKFHHSLVKNQEEYFVQFFTNLIYLRLLEGK